MKRWVRVWTGSWGWMLGLSVIYYLLLAWEDSWLLRIKKISVWLGCYPLCVAVQLLGKEIVLVTSCLASFLLRGWSEFEHSEMSGWLNGKVNSWEGRVSEKSCFYFILKVKAPVTFASQFLLNILLVVTTWEWKKCFWWWSCACAWLLASSVSLSSLTISSPFHSGSRSSKTFKPKKNIPEGSHQYELLKHAEATLGSGNLRMAVMLPEGEDLNEWVAVNSKSASSSDVRGC